jgi:pimeloyl-ACP methyl ester carboxylesterase
VTVRPHWPGRLVDLPTGVMHVRETGSAGGPGPDTRELAVMVHGLGGAATNWTDLMGLLDDRLHSVAPDLPGFGWSPPPQDGDYSVRAHARALTALLESVGDGRPVHLLGNSLGGTVALVVAATRPHLVRTLTLVSPAMPVLRPRLTNVHLPALAVPWAGQRLARRLGRFPVEQRVRATLALCYADPSRVPPQRVEEAMTEATRRAGLEHDGEAMLLSLRSLISAYLRPGTWPLWRLAEHVTAPTLLVYGLEDRLVDPRTATRAAKAIHGSRLVVVPDSGHVTQMEHPELVAREVRRLLARGPRVGAG